MSLIESAFFPVLEMPLQLEIESSKCKGDRGKAIIRTDTNEIINTCSSTYQLVPHRDVISAIESTFESNGLKYVLKNLMFFGKKDSSMRARYVIDEDKFLDKKVGNLIPMIDVSNSYDSLTKLNVSYGIYRIVCSNGMVVKQGNNRGIDVKVHIKQNIQVLNIFKSLDKFLNEMYPNTINRLSLLTTTKPKLFPEFEKILRPKELEEFQLQDLIEQYYQELGRNRYAQLQALTDYAKQRDTERRIELESNVLTFMEN